MRHSKSMKHTAVAASAAAAAHQPGRLAARRAGHRCCRCCLYCGVLFKAVVCLMLPIILYLSQYVFFKHFVSI